MKVLYIGKAAHICAASEGGSRFDRSMPSDERKAITNAIFLCSNCAEMIDRNGGADFSSECLHSWKEQHEAWVRTNLNRRPDAPLSMVSGQHEAHGQGEVTGLDIQGAAIISPGTVVKASGQGRVTSTRIGPPRKE